MTRRKREIVGLTNERDFPHLVELALPPGGFRSVFLEIDAFHRERRIPVRRGRSRHEAGMKTADLCRKHGISEASFYNWKAKYGGLEVSEAKRLRGLESENAKLKKLLADAMLDNAALKDVLAKKW